jgi:hypothetical protein
MPGMDPITQNGARLLSAFYCSLELATRGSSEGLAVARAASDVHVARAH